MAATADKRVLVIGAQGVLGGLVCHAFRDQGWSVRSGGRRPGPDVVHLDLDRPETVARAISPGELVVNTVPHPALVPERTVLERGGRLINVSALPAAAGRALRAIAGDARGTVLMNAGIAPGVTNLVAADLLAEHPEADEVQMVFTLSTAIPHGRASAEFAHRGLTALARHRTVVLPLPAPFGERRCLGFAEDDAGWLGGLAEGRTVRTYVCVAERGVHRSLLALNGTGAMARLPSMAFCSRQPDDPGEVSREPVAHWIAISRRGQRVRARTIECDGEFIQAAHATVVFAEAGLDSEGPPGCFDPEDLFTLEDVKSSLRAKGIRVVPQSGDGAVMA